jgi:tetratricopeptide (TPR) repeat protein
MLRKLALMIALMLGAGLGSQANAQQNDLIQAAEHAYDIGNYAKVMELLRPASTQDTPQAEIYLLLAKTYYQMQQSGPAVENAEKAVALDPQNSKYHEWLGRAYGQKAGHAFWFSAISVAKKSRREFQLAIQLDNRNFSAMQALVEYDCSAPGIVGGGVEKAQPTIERLAALDAAEGHYAKGNCRRQKNDFAAADEEFKRSLESDPKSADLIYDIGDYAVRRSQPDTLLRVAEIGERVAPADPRGNFYRPLAYILQKEKLPDAERELREYLNTAPVRDNYPTPSSARLWLGRALQEQNRIAEARQEFQAALRLDPKNKSASDALKRLPKP